MIFLLISLLNKENKGEKINKWDYSKIKRFCTSKEINKMKRKPIEWKNIFTNDPSDKGLISKI